MEIEVRYVKDNRGLEKFFTSFQALGEWIVNNGEDMLIIDVIQSEE